MIDLTNMEIRVASDLADTVNTEGDMIDYWDGGFFETGFNLRFH